MQTKIKKIVSGLIVFIMLMANMSPLGIHFGEVLASSNLNAQNTFTNNANVQCDVYFVEGEHFTHEATKNIREENVIAIGVSVDQVGYLKDAKIEFNNPNFILSGEIKSDKILNANENTVYLNQINAGESAMIYIPFVLKHGEKFNLEDLNKISTAKFEGIYLDGKGKERTIKKEINLGLKWTANAESEITAEITKYVKYDVDDQKGIALQVVVSEKVKDNLLPIKESNLEIQAPQINEVMPVDVAIYSTTKGYEAKFDKESGKLNITVKNDASEQNEVVWQENPERKYEITYQYPETAISEEEVKTKLAINTNTPVYAFDDKTLKGNLDEEITLKDQIGDLVDVNEEVSKEVSKGYMYANFDSKEKVETPYIDTITTDVSMPNLVDEITYYMNKDTFTVGEKQYEANTFYKKIKISKDVIKEFFGDEGNISIYSGEELIKKIDNTTEEKDTTVKLDADTIRIVTSKPVKTGRFTFELEKAVKGESTFTLDLVEKMTELNTNRIISSVGSEIVLSENKIQNKMTLVEPELKADLVLSNPNFETEEANKDVEIKVVLRTDSEYNKLYKNPVVVLEIPEHIEQMNIKSAQVLFDDELKVKSCNIQGRQIITELEGTQTKYNIGSGIQGTTIVFQADFTAKELTPKITEQLKMTVTSKDEKIESIADVHFIAPTGMVTINKITSIDNGQDLVALKEDEETTLELNKEAKNVTEEIKIINNNENEIRNVTVLGRVLATGTTDTDTGAALDNTLNIPMISGINTNGLEGVTVFYSTNGEATKDLEKAENGWTTEVADVTQVKSYLIKLDENAAMKIGDSATFTYDMQIPANLDAAKEAKSVYTVFFDNIDDEQSIPAKATSKKLSIGTAGTPTLEVQLSSYSEENSVIRNGQIVKFIATISNTGAINATNVKLKVNAPSETVYYYIDSDESEGSDEPLDNDDETDDEIYEEIEINVPNEGRVYTTDESALENHSYSGFAYNYSLNHILLDENLTNLGYHLLSTRSDGKDDATEDFSGWPTEEEQEVERDYDIRERTIDVGNLEAGKSIQVEYEMQVTEYSNVDYPEDIIVKLNAKVSADDMTEEVESNEYSLKLEDGLIDLMITRDRIETNFLTAGLDMTYDIYITSKCYDKTLNNTIVRFDVPEGLEIVNAAVEAFSGNTSDSESGEIEDSPECLLSLSNNNRRLNCSIDKLEPFDTIILRVHTTAVENVGNVSATVYAIVENKTHQGNYIDNIIEDLDYEIKQIEPDNTYVKENEEITIEYNLTNKSDISIPSFSFTNIVPDNMEIVSIKGVATDEEDQDDLLTYSITSDEDEENRTEIEIATELEPHQTQRIFVTLKAGFLPDGVTEKRVENYATTTLQGYNTKVSNKVIIIIEKNPNANRPIGEDPEDPADPFKKPDNDDTDDTSNGKKISGIAWMDKNVDGKRDDDETLILNMTVCLLDGSTKKEIKRTATDNNGEYQFTGLEEGEYLVVFLYDTSLYSLTQYKKSGVSLSVNSDAIDTTMEIDGESKKVGITDIIKVTDSNVRNIDIGICTASKTDMRLEKYISQVTVSYGSTVKTYNYDQLKIAKVEIPANQLSSATVIVEYKIVVSNEGSTSNYVKKIVDYVPSGMTFNSELNKDWYKSTSGDLYNSSLTNTKINPGESKELTLTLTKKMTENSTGVVNNNAEIYELYNEQGLVDSTATPGNKVSGEKDMSAADLVISVKTGDAVLYSVLIATIICLILGIGVYYIRKILFKGLERGVL